MIGAQMNGVVQRRDADGARPDDVRRVVLRVEVAEVAAARLNFAV